MAILAFADVTGTVTASDIEAAFLLEHPYARSLGRFGRAVTLRYRALLSELDATWPGQAGGEEDLAEGVAVTRFP